MDISTVIGFVLVGALLFLGIGPANISYFIDIPSLIIVATGTVASLLINFPLSGVLGMGGFIKNTVFFQSVDLQAELNRMVDFASVARRDGLLALEGKVDDIEDPFLIRGVQMIIDGVQPESVRSILEIELGQMMARHSVGKGVVDAGGAAAPAFGMIGTLIGLVLMLQNLDDPSALGPGMAVALVTTFYGAVIANALFIPVAGKLGERNKEEILARQVTIEGVLAIQAGENPNVIRERLNGFLPPRDRIEKE